MPESLHLVCPHCGGINRVPQEKRSLNPLCGKCHRPLFTGKPHSVDQAGFERHIQRNQLPVVVDFWAAWCGPCKMMAPAFDQAAGLLEPDARLLKVDTEACPELSMSLGIRSIPTLALFQEGKEVDRISGALDAKGLVTWIRGRI